MKGLSCDWGHSEARQTVCEMKGLSCYWGHSDALQTVK